MNIDMPSPQDGAKRIGIGKTLLAALGVF
jgi:hypothetical protein